MPDSRHHVVHERRVVFKDFFSLEEVIVSHDQVNGLPSDQQRRLILQRGDALAVLLFNSDTEEVVLVNQFRAPTLGKGLWSIRKTSDDWTSGDGWIVELMAGMIPQTERDDPRVTAVRETKEETGYQIDKDQLEHIATFFTSPGGTSERIFLYFANVRGPRPAERGGVGDEDIEIKHLTADALFELLQQNRIEDSKLLIGAMWLQHRSRKQSNGSAPRNSEGAVSKKLETKIRRELETALRTSLEEKIKVELDDARKKASQPLNYSVAKYELAKPKGRYIGYHTGAIRNVQGVDAWVKSENEDMMMDRDIGRTISANIRRLGAEIDRHGVREDTIAIALADAVAKRERIRTRDVLVTTAGALKNERNVHRISPVATVRGGYDEGGGFKASLDDLPVCVSNVLNEVEAVNARRLVREKDQSILFPILGAGDGNLTVEAVTPKLVRAAVEFFEKRPDTVLKEVYFLAYTERHKRACEDVFGALRDEKRLIDKPGQIVPEP